MTNYDHAIPAAISWMAAPRRVHRQKFPLSLKVSFDSNDQAPPGQGGQGVKGVA